MLNILWPALFLIAFFSATVQLFLGDTLIFGNIMDNIFDMAKLSVDIALGLVGLMCFWMGLARIAESAGCIQGLAKCLAPVFRRLMPEVPASDPALGTVTLNLAANMLGLDNAATPLGIKAMTDLQRLNPNPDTATNAQIMFLVLNTSSVTLFPVTIFMYRAELGAINPMDVFIPILLATIFSSCMGIWITARCQNITIMRRTTAAITLTVISLLIFGGSLLIKSGMDNLSQYSALAGQVSIAGLISLLLIIALKRQVDLYDCFIEGAKQGFQVSIQIIPYLVAMLTAIAALRASGVFDALLSGLRWLLDTFSLDTRFVDGLPTALMKPFSGSGARAMMIETFNTHGADSFAGRLASIMQGSTETTFYVLAVYFGAIKVTKIRHAIGAGLFADLAGITAAIFLTYAFFGHLSH